MANLTNMFKGAASGVDVLGADNASFGLKDIFNIAAEAGGKGIDYYQSQQAAGKAAKDSAAALAAAIEADNAATQAAADAMVSSPASAEADKTLADITAMASAAAVLSPADQAKRVKVATDAVKAAAKAAQASPGDRRAQALVKAAQATLARVSYGQIAGMPGGAKPKPAGTSWFAKKAGPLSRSAWFAVGGVAAVSAAVLGGVFGRKRS